MYRDLKNPCLSNSTSTLSYTTVSATTCDADHASAGAPSSWDHREVSLSLGSVAFACSNISASITCGAIGCEGSGEEPVGRTRTASEVEIELHTKRRAWLTAASRVRCPTTVAQHGHKTTFVNAVIQHGRRVCGVPEG